jgi:hypothetical protein
VQIETNPVAACDAERRQTITHAVGQRVEVPVTDRALAWLDDRHRVRRSPRTRDEAVLQRRATSHHATVEFFDRMSRAIFARSSRFSLSISWGSKDTLKRSSRNMTSLSVAMESRMPPLISGVVSGEFVGVLARRNSFMMKSLIVDVTLSVMSRLRKITM